MLTDNGSEFSDWDGLGALFGEERGAGSEGGPAPRLSCCDPMRSGQKGGCEKNHTEVRRVLAKGLLSFDLLREADLSPAVSHADPAPRRSLMGMAPSTCSWPHTATTAAVEALAPRRRQEGARGAGGRAVGKLGPGNLDGAARRAAGRCTRSRHGRPAPLSRCFQT